MPLPPNLPRQRNSYAIHQSTGQVKAFGSPWEPGGYCFDHPDWAKVSGQGQPFAAQRLRLYRRRKQEREGAADMRREANERHGAARTHPGREQKA